MSLEKDEKLRKQLCLRDFFFYSDCECFDVRFLLFSTSFAGTGFLRVLDVGLSVSSLLFAFRAGGISCLFRVSKRHLYRTLSDILTAFVMVP